MRLDRSLRQAANCCSFVVLESPTPSRLQRFPVTISRRPYPIPSRTRKSSSPEPMVLHWQRCGRVGRRRANLIKPRNHFTRLRGFLFCPPHRLTPYLQPPPPPTAPHLPNPASAPAMCGTAGRGRFAELCCRAGGLPLRRPRDLRTGVVQKQQRWRCNPIFLEYHAGATYY